MDGWGASGGTDDGMMPMDAAPGMQRNPHPSYPKIIEGQIHGPPPRPAPAGQRYRCDDPPGYYPYTSTCRAPWRPVSSLSLW